MNFKVDPTSLLDATDFAWLNQFSADNKYVGNKGTYEPGPSECKGPSGENIYTYNGGIYAQNPPPAQNQLALSANGTPVIVTGVTQESIPGFPHALASPTPNCPVATPTP